MCFVRSVRCVRKRECDRRQTRRSKVSVRVKVQKTLGLPLTGQHIISVRTRNHYRAIDKHVPNTSTRDDSLALTY